MRRALVNVVVAPVTAFDEHAEVDLIRLRQHVSYLVGNGVTSILGGASVSEFFSLTCEEWQTPTEALVEAADGRAWVIAAISYHTPRQLSRWGKRQRPRAPCF